MYNVLCIVLYNVLYTIVYTAMYTILYSEVKRVGKTEFFSKVK